MRHFQQPLELVVFSCPLDDNVQKMFVLIEAYDIPIINTTTFRGQRVRASVMCCLGVHLSMGSRHHIDILLISTHSGVLNMGQQYNTLDRVRLC